MDKIFRIAAYLANGALVFSAFFILAHSYGGRDTGVAMLLMVPPVLSILALRCGPDREERQLRRDVAKARLRKELKDLGGQT